MDIFCLITSTLYLVSSLFLREFIGPNDLHVFIIYSVYNTSENFCNASIVSDYTCSNYITASNNFHKKYLDCIKLNLETYFGIAWIFFQMIFLPISTCPRINYILLFILMK